MAASRAKRSTSTSSRPRRILSATAQPSRRSKARKTVPIPPPPARRSRRKRPAMSAPGLTRARRGHSLDRSRRPAEQGAGPGEARGDPDDPGLLGDLLQQRERLIERERALAQAQGLGGGT